MHEASIVRALLTQVCEIQQAHQGLPVREVRLQLGPLSGVEAALLVSAFDLLVPETSAVGARLTVEPVPLEAACSACGTTFQPPRFRMTCPACQSTCTRIMRGDSVMLDSVTLGTGEKSGEEI